jgi:hypothetical protein
MSALATTVATRPTVSSSAITGPRSVLQPGTAARPSCRASAIRSCWWLDSPTACANRVTLACDTPARSASAAVDSSAAVAGSASTKSATSRNAPVSRGSVARTRSATSTTPTAEASDMKQPFIEGRVR